MDLKKLLHQFSNNTFIKLSEQEFSEILSKSIVIEEKDTLISDFIRILNIEDNYFVQELSKQNEILMRHFNSIEAAREFVEDRIEIYDKMWDGCGCKVNYYD